MGFFDFIFGKRNNKDKELQELTSFLIKEKTEEIGKKYDPITSYSIRGEWFNIGDKVLCRSNEPNDLIVGEIVEFWDNEGKWTEAVPMVHDIKSNKTYTCFGIVKKYSDELLTNLNTMKPLEQWNFLVEEPYRYTPEQILKKEQNFLKKKFVIN
jgi:hypothetical protein